MRARPASRLASESENGPHTMVVSATLAGENRNLRASDRARLARALQLPTPEVHMSTHAISSLSALIVALAFACEIPVKDVAPNTDGASGSSGGNAGGDSGGSVGVDSGGGGTTAGSGGGGGSAGSAGSAGAFDCTSSGAEPAMVKVPAGPFDMGCNGALDADCLDDEKPSHEVTLSAFEIDETEVTQDQYAECVLAGTCDPPLCAWDCSAKNYPAACVTWDQAKMYCAWAKKRLPTEAEWEKAARGTDGRKYPWGKKEPSCSEANMTGCGEKAAPVGSHSAGASPYGALDMAGNMVEMLEDFYDATYYQSSPLKDPKGPAQGKRFVGRGGGYKSKALWQRTSSRDWYDPPDFGKPLGFRCAR